MLMRSEKGSALIEFAVTLPVLMTLVIGAMRFGIAANNYIMLTDAVRVGARTFALQRGSATPYSTARGRVTSSAPNLLPVGCPSTSGLCITLQVNGAACATDAACQTAINTAYTTGNADVTVQAGYLCNLTVYGINFAGGSCSITALTTERLE